MSCGDKKINTCGKKIYSSCIIYEGELSVHTNITDECYSEEEVIEDTNGLVDEIFTDIDMTGLTSDCLTLPVNPIVKTVMQLILDTLCAQKTLIDDQATLIETMQLQIVDLQNDTCPPTP